MFQSQSGHRKPMNRSSCSIERKLVLCVCSFKGINSEGTSGRPLDIIADPRDLYSCAGEEKRKVHLSCAPDLRMLTQLRQQKQEKSRRSVSQKHSNQTAHRPDRTGSENVCYTSLLSCACEDAASKVG